MRKNAHVMGCSLLAENMQMFDVFKNTSNILTCIHLTHVGHKYMFDGILDCFVMMEPPYSPISLMGALFGTRCGHGRCQEQGTSRPNSLFPDVMMAAVQS